MWLCLLYMIYNLEISHFILPRRRNSWVRSEEKRIYIVAYPVVDVVQLFGHFQI